MIYDYIDKDLCYSIGTERFVKIVASIWKISSHGEYRKRKDTLAKLKWLLDHKFGFSRTFIWNSFDKSIHFENPEMFRFFVTLPKWISQTRIRHLLFDNIKKINKYRSHPGKRALFMVKNGYQITNRTYLKAMCTGEVSIVKWIDDNTDMTEKSHCTAEMVMEFRRILDQPDMIKMKEYIDSKRRR